MKKLLIITLLALAASSVSAVRSIPHTIKCYKCKQSYIDNPQNGANPNTIANRHCELEYEGYAPEGYCVYKCQHGHTLYVNFDTGDRK